MSERQRYLFLKEEAENIAATVAGIAIVLISIKKTSHNQWLNDIGLIATPPMKARGPMSGIKE
jgi:hypothetical protein